MKKLFSILFISSILFWGCEKDSDFTIEGDQSDLGKVGTTISSSTQPIAGISNFSAEVTSLEDGVSSIDGEVTITNSVVKQILSNVPGVEISGDKVSARDVEVKFTSKGIENKYPFFQGVLVNYDSKVGDTYPIKDSKTVRKVIYKSTTDDYSYAFYKIKIITIEHEINFNGLKKITYWVNHKYGVVRIEFELDNDEKITMPFYFGSNI
jgi:hypothetical protein